MGSHRRPGFLAALTLALLAPATSAAAAPRTAPVAVQAEDADTAERLISDDVKFAENLARYRFFDLATDVLDNVKGEQSSDDVRGTIAFTRSRVLRRQSDTMGDENERIEVLGQAIDLLADWAKPGSRHSYHPRKAEALQDLGEMLGLRGTLHCRAGRSPRAEADFKAADAAYSSLRRECEDLAEHHRDNGDDDLGDEFEERAALTYYFRGKNNLDWVPCASDRELRLEQAADALVEFQWEAPSDSLPSLLAVHYEGVAREMMGETEEAITLQETVLEDCTLMFWDNLGAFSPGARLRIANLMDQTWCALARLRLKTGDTADALALVADMEAAHAAALEPEGQPYGGDGLDAILALAGELGGAGEGREQSRLIQLVAEEGRGTAAGAQAGRQLSDMLEAGGTDGSGVNSFDANALISAAQSLAEKNDHRGAAHYFLQAAAAAQGSDGDDAQRIDAWKGAAVALQRDGRELESAIALEKLLDEGLAAKNDEITEQAATKMYAAYDRRYRETGDAFDKDLRNQAAVRMQKLGIVIEIVYQDALEKFNDALRERSVQQRKPADKRNEDAYRRLFAQAEDQFSSVPETSPNYEKSLVYRARALAEAGRHAEALQQFDLMLERAKDPAFEPQTTDTRKRREVAHAQATYRKAELMLDEAVNRPDEVLSLIAGFETSFPGQEGFFEQVKYQRVAANALRGDPEAADAALDALRDLREDSSFVSLGAYRTARAYKDAYDEVADNGGTADPALLERAAELMWEHCQTAGRKVLGNYQVAGEWFARVKRHEDAETVFAAAEATFSGQPNVPESVLDQARIGLGEALNAQHEFGTASRLWRDLHARNARDPVVLRGAARCYGGWLEREEDGSLREIGGSGEYNEATSLWSELKKGSDFSAKYHEIWWEAKFGAVYSLYRQGQKDAAQQEIARKVLNNQRTITPGYDKDTMDSLEEEHRFEPYFHLMFRYLDRNLP